MRLLWIGLLLAGCGSAKKAGPPAEPAPPPADASPPSTEFLDAVTAPGNGLTPACVGGAIAPAIAELAATVDCRGPVAGYRDVTVRGHHVVVVLDAAGELRGWFDGQPLDKIRLDEGPVVAAFPPPALPALADDELGPLLATLAGVAMINPPRRMGYTPAGVAALRTDWPQAPIGDAPSAVILDHGERRVRLWYELEDPPACRELWCSDLWLDRAGALAQLTYRHDRRGATCPQPPPSDPDRGNFFPD
ncbi:MAG: hypothetical protein IPL61_03815 [Myxococcales bacterium]|nr:hypothetical protein [Myxococcales bacterium]